MVRPGVPVSWREDFEGRLLKWAQDRWSKDGIEYVIGYDQDTQAGPGCAGDCCTSYEDVVTLKFGRGGRKNPVFKTYYGSFTSLLDELG